MAVVVVDETLIKVDGYEVYTFTDDWKHTEDRVLAAKKSAKNEEEFKKKMITRLKRIKHRNKLYCAVAVLHKYGYEEIANMYTGRIVMDKLLGDE